jgi:hypothetical protein
VAHPKVTPCCIVQVTVEESWLSFQEETAVAAHNKVSYSQVTCSTVPVFFLFFIFQQMLSDIKYYVEPKYLYIIHILDIKIISHLFSVMFSSKPGSFI